MSRSTSLIACLDVGSTWTKLAVVDVAEGRLVATAAHPTTVDTDVLDGVDALLRGAGPVDEVRCCSSAGGGLRLAVVGYEALVSAEAAHRVALSAGARVVHVAAGRLDAGGLAALKADRPDVVLLVGGTDGGDAEVLLHNAARLARGWPRSGRQGGRQGGPQSGPQSGPGGGSGRGPGGGPRVPVVVAGNADARDEVVALLRARSGTAPVIAAGNVLPRIGALDPQPARAAIREVFLRHVIGGKRLSKGSRFARLVRAATPDAVLTGVEVLADSLDGDLLVVDVGGATTDVYSALTPDERAAVAGTMWRSRTVEGDLGVRWSAPGVVAAARAEKLPLDEERAASLAGGAFAGALDYAAVAATVAVRRHARSGRDLRDVRLVVASGGVFRHATRRQATGALEATVHDHAGGWALPRAPMITVDADYVLAPAGLLADDHRDVATALLRAHLHVR